MKLSFLQESFTNILKTITPRPNEQLRSNRVWPRNHPRPNHGSTLNNSSSNSSWLHLNLQFRWMTKSKLRLPPRLQITWVPALKRTRTRRPGLKWDRVNGLTETEVVTPRPVTTIASIADLEVEAAAKSGRTGAPTAAGPTLVRGGPNVIEVGGPEKGPDRRRRRWETTLLHTEDQGEKNRFCSSVQLFNSNFPNEPFSFNFWYDFR